MLVTQTNPYPTSEVIMNRSPITPFVARVLSTSLAVGMANPDGFVASDVVRRHMEEWGWGPEHPNQWGAAFRSLHARGFIEPVSSLGAYAPLTYRSHLAPRNGGRNVAWQLTLDAYALCAELSV